MRCIIFIERKKKKERKKSGLMLLQIHIPPRIVSGSKESSNTKTGMCFLSWRNAQVILRATLTRLHSLTSNEDSVPLEHQERLAHADQPGIKISHYSCEIKLAWNLFKSKQLMEFQRLNCPNKFKGTVHPKIYILSFTHPRVTLNPNTVVFLKWSHRKLLYSQMNRGLICLE